jgi:8-oxo-dGTP diphosphatase
MTLASSRSYPARPILAASIAVFRDGKVLLAERVNPPAADCFSLPGGLVEVGETLEQAALRELDEETGVTARILRFNGHVEVIARDGQDRVERHFVVASFIGEWIAGEGATGAEARTVLWADPLRLDGLPLTPGLKPLLEQAAALLDRSR